MVFMAVCFQGGAYYPRRLFSWSNGDVRIVLWSSVGQIWFNWDPTVSTKCFLLHALKELVMKSLGYKLKLILIR